MLHEASYRAGHTAVIIGVLSVHGERLAQLGRSIRDYRGVSLIEKIVVLTVQSDDRNLCARIATAASDQLGIDDVTLLVVRPDGHVGLRADRDHLEALAAYHALVVSGI